jgi:hypothetical protein
MVLPLPILRRRQTADKEVCVKMAIHSGNPQKICVERQEQMQLSS